MIHQSLIKTWQTVLISIGLSLIIIFFTNSLAFAQNGTPTPTPPSGSESGGIVTQPPIIPKGAIPSGTKLYLPHDTTNTGNKTYLQNTLLPGIASTIIGITGGLALVFVVISGIQYLTAYGDSTVADKAKKTLTFALIGVILAGLSYAIVAIISTINVNNIS